MDKIQAAIAKARAARTAGQTDAPEAATEHKPAAAPATAPGPSAPAPVSATPSPKAAAPVNEPAPADRLAVWKPLATCAPDARQMARHRVVTFDTSGQIAKGATQFDVLRTKVLQQMRANGWKRLAITSPGAHCGKSTVVLNLAFSLSKRPDLHTIVAELDMRRPSLAKTLGIKGDTSIASVLAGEADFADVAVRPRPNLAFGVNYTRARNPAELLQSPAIGPALARIETRFAPDLTLFDMPPMLVSDDTMAFMGQVDCVLLVAGAGSTSVREIDVCERDLAAQTNVLGVILNKCRYMEKDYAYDYSSGS